MLQQRGSSQLAQAQHDADKKSADMRRGDWLLEGDDVEYARVGLLQSDRKLSSSGTQPKQPAVVLNYSTITFQDDRHWDRGKRFSQRANRMGRPEWQKNSSVQG
jgi:hypothetical protein